MIQLCIPNESTAHLQRPGGALCLWVVVSVIALAGCAGVRDKVSNLSISNMVTPYKVDVLQGNLVTREQTQALQPGMPRAQVRDILGSPLLASVFHADRWDYVFTFRRQGQEPQQRKLAVFFKDGAMERFESDDLPSEAEFVASLDKRQSAEKPPVLVATEEQLKAFQERNAVPAKPAMVTSVPDAASNTSYPPLESSGVSR